MSNKPLSFRFPDEFAKVLRTWAFVTETDQRALLQEAFQEYAERRPEIKEKVDKVMSTLD
ncbi:hypothetical protein [Paenibacillus sp. FSL R5-808]|jgi:predicted nucleotide-binding protein (sugar kinase/HSP70/actin superfamily)|uniref:hypothetical protein n=1 Tax=Paenibacillus sp. FSL R5-808 TaxID=1227076 RepID=UPI0004B8B3CF|nr:hypothetical protein [Paenibacillus sp. FSL R5-808]